MLLKAIGTDLRVLYFFDQTHNRYIEFKRESENTYHGFHLDSLFSIKNSTFVLIN